MKWLSAALPFLVAPPLLILAAIWQGKETERWGEFPEMKQFADRLENLPLKIGPWIGTRRPGLTESVRKAAGAEGDLHIIYQNDGSVDPLQKGVEVDMFIDCGRLLDQSKHRPDRCFPAQGYKADGEETLLQKVQPEGQKSKADFRTAVYTKEDQGIKNANLLEFGQRSRLESAGWRRRLAQGVSTHQAIYKLYVSNSLGGTKDQPGVGPSIDLIKVLVPAYDKVLFPDVEETNFRQGNRRQSNRRQSNRRQSRSDSPGKTGQRMTLNRS